MPGNLPVTAPIKSLHAVSAVFVAAAPSPPSFPCAKAPPAGWCFCVDVMLFQCSQQARFLQCLLLSARNSSNYGASSQILLFIAKAFDLSNILVSAKINHRLNRGCREAASGAGFGESLVLIWVTFILVLVQADFLSTRFLLYFDTRPLNRSIVFSSIILQVLIIYGGSLNVHIQKYVGHLPSNGKPQLIKRSRRATPLDAYSPCFTNHSTFQRKYLAT